MRDALDRYYTPDPVAARCVAALRIPAPSWVLEPSIGGGAFARAVGAYFFGTPIDGIDANPLAAGLGGLPVTRRRVGDFLALDPLELRSRQYALIVGNPPYRDAEAHVRRALEIVQRGGTVAFLLRIAFLASASRRPLWRQHPPSEVWILPERPSFTGDGKTDGADYAFFVWGPDAGSAPPRIGWLPPA